MKPQPITQARLHELLCYDPETGVFTRRITTNWRSAAGTVCDYRNYDGYVKIRVDRNQLQAHRLAWLYVHGEWPALQVDHINGVRHDNRIANLRLATNSQNQQNQRKARGNTASGILGVRPFPRTGKWVAGIQIGGKRKHLGYFSTPEEAEAAYLSAKAELHPFQSIIEAGK